MVRMTHGKTNDGNLNTKSIWICDSGCLGHGLVYIFYIQFYYTRDYTKTQRGFLSLDSPTR